MGSTSLPWGGPSTRAKKEPTKQHKDNAHRCGWPYCGLSYGVVVRGYLSPSVTPLLQCPQVRLALLWVILLWVILWEPTKRHKNNAHRCGWPYSLLEAARKAHVHAALQVLAALNHTSTGRPAFPPAVAPHLQQLVRNCGGLAAYAREVLKVCLTRANSHVECCVLVPGARSSAAWHMSMRALLSVWAPIHVIICEYI